MSELIICATKRVCADSAYVACVGQDSRCTPWAWLMLDSSRTGTNDSVEVPDDQLLPCPSGVPNDRLLTLLAYWPAWRVTEWAGPELGSTVLIVGSGGFAKQVADLCRCRGVLWRAIRGASRSEEYGEYWIPPSDRQQAREMLRVLPMRPDSVVVLEDSGHALRVALEVCRDLGVVVVAMAPAAALDVNLYPDVHRRGLTIRAGSPFKHEFSGVEAWRRDVRRIDALINVGLLAP